MRGRGEGRARSVGTLKADESVFGGQVTTRDVATHFNNHRVIGRIGEGTPAADRRILLGKAA
jgi:hypothetical protein